MIRYTLKKMAGRRWCLRQVLMKNHDFTLCFWMHKGKTKYTSLKSNTFNETIEYLLHCLRRHWLHWYYCLANVILDVCPFCFLGTLHIHKKEHTDTHHTHIHTHTGLKFKMLIGFFLVIFPGEIYFNFLKCR